MRVLHLGIWVHVCPDTNSKTISPIDLIFLHKKYCAILYDDLDRDSRIYLKILNCWEIGENMPSMYAAM